MLLRQRVLQIRTEVGVIDHIRTVFGDRSRHLRGKELSQIVVALLPLPLTSVGVIGGAALIALACSLVSATIYNPWIKVRDLSRI